MQTAEPLALMPKPAAKYIDISLASLYNQIRLGRIPAHKFGRRTLIKVEDLKAWLNALPQKEAA